MPTQVDDELEKYAAKPSTARPSSDDDELEKYVKKSSAAAPKDSLEDYLSKPYSSSEASGGSSEKPGFFKRLGQSVGLPASMDEAQAGIKSSLSDLALGGPIIPAAKGAYAWGKRAVKNIGEGIGEEVEAGKNIAAGQPILPNIGKAAYGIVHGGVGSLPFIGEPIETAGEDVLNKNYAGAAGGLTGVIGQVVAPELVGGAIRSVPKITTAFKDRFTTPAVSGGLSREATANLQEPLARRGIEKTLSATSMPAGQHNLREAFTLAAPDLAEMERLAPLKQTKKAGGFVNPDLRIRETVKNIDDHLDSLWNMERKPQIDRNGELQTLTREQLLGDATPEQIGRIEKSFKMAIPQEINLATADKLLVKVNTRLRGAEGMTPEGRAMALELSPDLQRFNEMKGALHENIGGLLERVGEPGIKEFNRRYGALSQVRDALRNRMNPEESIRVLDALRVTGGIGRNVNLFERLHLKASPGRNLQKGLEELAQTGLRITPATPRPPTAGLLPAPATPMGGPVDMGGSARSGRWTTAAGLLGDTPPIQGEYIPPGAPQAAPRTSPFIHPIESPAGVQDPFRIQAPRMRSGTVPPIEPVTSSTMLPGGAGVREMRLLPGGTEPSSVAAPGTPKPIPPIEPVKPAAPVEDTGAKRSQAIQELSNKISDLRRQNKEGTEEYNNAWELRSQLRQERRQASSAELDQILGNLKEGVRKIADKHYEETIPIQDRMENAQEALAKVGEKPEVPEGPEPEEVKIKGVTAEEPKQVKGAKKIKPIPVEKRFTTDEILNAEGLLNTESGAMLSADRPNIYFDENEMGQYNTQKQQRGGVKAGGTIRGLASGRNMHPFMREHPDLAPSAVQKALRNKDSAAYQKLVQEAVEFNRREESRGAEDFLNRIDNPDAEPANVAPEAESFNPEEFTPPGEPAAAPAPQQNVPRGTIPPIEIAQRGGILPGMEQHVAEQNAGAARVAGEGLTSEANRPKDISQAAGRMETMSPLFRGTEASPQREIFGNAPNAPNAPAPASMTPPVIEAALRDSGWTYEGKNNLGQYTIKEPGTNIKISLFERQLNEDFIRRKIAEKEKQFGVPQEKKPQI
jgi:hypothetical protein